MARPLYDLVVVRKDKADFDGVNWKGETRRGKHMKIGAVWADRRSGEPGSVTFETAALHVLLKLGVDEFWINVKGDRSEAPVSDADIPF